MIDTNIVMKQLVALEHMSIEELRVKFREFYGFDSACANLKQLKRRLAFRIQEVYYGGLEPAEKAILQDVAASDPATRLEKDSTPNRQPVRGTRFSREWHGRIYEVIAVENDMFEYDGRLFRSLSGIAKEITGSTWNGRLFFGLTDKAGKPKGTK